MSHWWKIAQAFSSVILVRGKQVDWKPCQLVRDGCLDVNNLVTKVFRHDPTKIETIIRLPQRTWIVRTRVQHVLDRLPLLLRIIGLVQTSFEEITATVRYDTVCRARRYLVRVSSSPRGFQRFSKRRRWRLALIASGRANDSISVHLV